MKNEMKKVLSLLFTTLFTIGTVHAQILECKKVEDGGSGHYKAVIAHETGLDEFTVYRPADIKTAADKEGKLPLVVFGNGGCANTSDAFEKFLTEIASHGYVIVAIGPYPPMQGREGMTDASLLNKAIDLMEGLSSQAESEFNGAVDLGKVAAMEQSCGGLQALDASLDPRIATTVVLNSGILKGMPGGMGGAKMKKEDLAKLHAPIIYMLGGPTDIAYENGKDDFAQIQSVPAVCASLPVGHMATYREPLGGEFAKVAVKWLDWQLKGKEENRSFFLGAAEDRAGHPEWTVEHKNFAAQGVRLRPDNIDEVVAAMTLEEKAHMVNGIGTFWGGSASCRNLRDIPGAPGGMYDIPRLGIPALYMGDGPLGLRISETRDWDSHHYYTTAVPVPLLLASSWDPELVYEGAQDIAEECRDYGVDVMLGPSFNLIRNPLGGRTHEYYSEDPLLSGEMAAAFTNGVQSVGIAASVKHFAANNQETNRNAVNSVISQRALREIYLKSFEIAVGKANPWTVMTSYNGINGDWTSESKELLEDILRGDWGYQGMVMTDWGGGVHPVAQMIAGNDLLEPGNEQAAKQIVEAVKTGTLDEAVLDRNVHRILELVVKSFSFKGYKFSNNPDLASHQALTRRGAAESSILLKNDSDALPFGAHVKNIALYGKTAYDVIPGGIGGNEYNSGNYCISLVEGLRLAGYTVDASLIKKYPKKQGMASPFPFGPRQDADPDADKEPSFTADEFSAQTAGNDIAVIVLGHVAGEGSDRTKPAFYLNESERQLVKDVCSAYHQAGKKAVVVLNIPGPIEVESWKDYPDAILCVYQCGEQLGNSVADVLKGAVNPSGKLTVTFAKDIMDYPSSKNFPVAEQEAQMTGMMGNGMRFERKDRMTVDGERNKDYTVYEEGVYVGYRYFDTFGIPVSYPFGYGLSYTSFDYSDAKISRDGDRFTVSVKITNIGKYSGKESVQLYVSAPKGRLDKPVKELRAFAKTGLLAPGASETVSMTVSKEDLASFNGAKSAWETDRGTYTFHVAASVSDVKASLTGQVDKPWSKTVRNVLKPQVAIDELKAPKRK